MSIEKDMYNMIKKSSSRPIIFLDMDNTILVRDVDMNMFLSKVRAARSHLSRFESGDKEEESLSERREFKLNRSRRLIEDYDSIDHGEFFSGNVSFLIRPNVCELVNASASIGDVYILTASDRKNASHLFEFLKGPEVSKHFPCFSKIKGLISSLSEVRFNSVKTSFTEEDVGHLSEEYFLRPYVLVDDNNKFAVESKHVLMSHPDQKNEYRDFDLHHIQVPKFSEGLAIDFSKIIEQIKEKINSQRLQ